MPIRIPEARLPQHRLALGSGKEGHEPFAISPTAHTLALEHGRGQHREQGALRREGSSTLRRERQQLVDQLERNLEAARLGMDEREARLLALSTRLERIDGGLRQLQRQVDRQWPSSEVGDAAMAEAIAPLDEALDQIERLLDAGKG
ncbi:MAG: hypothetical protein ACKO22_02260 [Cyanobium sp.]